MLKLSKLAKLPKCFFHRAHKPRKNDTFTPFMDTKPLHEDTFLCTFFPPSGSAAVKIWFWASAHA